MSGHKSFDMLKCCHHETKYFQDWYSFIYMILTPVFKKCSYFQIVVLKKRHYFHLLLANGNSEVDLKLKGVSGELLNVQGGNILDI